MEFGVEGIDTEWTRVASIILKSEPETFQEMIDYSTHKPIYRIPQTTIPNTKKGAKKHLVQPSQNSVNIVAPMA